MGGGVGRFLSRSAVYAGALLVVLAATYYGVDPLHTARRYEEYYTDGLYVNPAIVGISNFNHWPDHRKYDSFILGNSFSKAVSVAKWKRYLPADARPYHLTSDCQHLPLTVQMLDYVAANVDSLRHVLWFTSMWSLQDSLSRDAGVLPHPIIYRGLERWRIAAEHMCMGLSRPMIIMGVSRLLSGELLYTPRVRVPIQYGVDYDSSINEIVCSRDINFVDTVSVESDFYRLWCQLNGRRITVERDRITPGVESLLRRLKSLCDSYGAVLDVVIMPDEERLVMSAHDVGKMYEIFGDRFHDMTYCRVIERDDMRNFYDMVHFDTDMTGRFLDDALGDKEE